MHKNSTTTHSGVNSWLEHAKDIICNNNDFYVYILNWISYIIQNPGLKVETCPIFIGGQGSGKGAFFQEIIAALFGRYSMPNVTRIETVIGRFNTAMENKVYANFNEMDSIENVKYFNMGNMLKSIITEYDIDYEAKHIDIRGGFNVLNAMMFTNHELPIKLEDKERRHPVIRTSNKKCADTEYFDDLAYEIGIELETSNHFTTKEDRKKRNEEFMNELFTILSNRPLKGFQPSKYSDTKDRKDVMQASEESWLSFFKLNIEKFVSPGWITTDC